MKRRTLLTAVVGVLAAGAGCTGLSSEDDDAEGDEDESRSESESDDDEGEDAEPSESDLLEGFESTLEDRGFERVDLERVDDGLELGYDATGSSDDNVATEIELITDGYTTTIEGGSSTAYLEATAYDPEDGDALDYFTIETEWVEAYLDGDLEWPELLSRIAGTFVSTEPADDEAAADDEGDESDEDAGDGGDEAGGDDDPDDGSEGSEPAEEADEDGE